MKVQTTQSRLKTCLLRVLLMTNFSNWVTKPGKLLIFQPQRGSSAKENNYQLFNGERLKIPTANLEKRENGDKKSKADVNFYLRRP
jgi:hypothetical protein